MPSSEFFNGLLYTLTDRATWIHFKNKQNLVIEVRGGPHLFNQYGVFL